MKSYNLEYYVNKLAIGEKFSLARYGDGELYCMWGRQGGNSNGCRYSPELREALLESVDKPKPGNFIYGLQRVLPKDAIKTFSMWPNIEWHDSEVFGEAVANGKLFPLITQLKKMEMTIIGNKTIRPVADLIGASFIEVPPSNAYDFRDEILNREWKDNHVYLFSCGMAANAFVYYLHGKYDSWFIDVGHIWDPLVGIMSRCDLLDKSLEDMQKNLCEK